MKEIQKEEILSSVDAYKINKALKLNTVTEGKPTDNVLVHGEDNEVKFVTRSEFGGGLQTLQQVFDNTPTGAEGSYTSPNATNESVLSVAANDREAHALLGSKYGTYNGTIEILDGKTTLTQGSVDDGASLVTTTVGFENPLVNTVLKLPAATVAGNYTLATTTDIVTKLDRNDVAVGYPRVYAARGNGTQTMYNVQTAPIITNTGNVNAVPNVQVVKDYVDIPASATVTGVVNNVPLQELGGTDKLVNGVRIGKGSGTGIENTALGYNTLTVNTSDANTAVGDSVLGVNTTGESNTGVGDWSLYKNISGSYNAGVGSSSLFENTVGESNTAMGSYSLAANTTGSYNTAVGTSALGQNVTGKGNTAVGTAAGYNVTGDYNIGIGNNTMHGVITPILSGSFNTAIGFQAGRDISTGSRNILIENITNASITTGNNNIVLNPRQKSGITTGSGNTIIGGFDGAFAANDSELVVLATGTGKIAIRKNTNGEIIAPNLTNALITSGGDQSIVTKKYLESKVQVVDNTTTSVLSLATLNSTYSTFSIGSKVQCMSITTGALIYEKTLTGWAQHSVITVQ